MAEVARIPQTNGFHTHTSVPAVAQSSEYERILQIHREIVEGSHPRLKIAVDHVRPEQVAVPKPSPKAASQAGHGPPFTTQSSLAQASNQPKPFPTTASPFATAINASVRSVNKGSSHPSGKKSPVLDDIFLEKSDVLVRAEMRLEQQRMDRERERIERILEDQWRQKTDFNKQRLADLESFPDFDVTEVFYQAQELVPHLAANDNVINAARNEYSIMEKGHTPSDPSDESTYYTSAISAEDLEASHPTKAKTMPCKFFFAGHCKKGDACNLSHDPAFKRQLERTKEDGRHWDNPRNAIRHGTPVNEFGRPNMENDNNASNERGRAGRYNLRNGGAGDGSVSQTFREHPQSMHSRYPDHRDEGRARPPYYIDPHPHRRSPEALAEIAYPHGRDDHRDPPSAQRANDGKVVRSHITSPIAPQPARVSPLAVAKVPRLTQSHRNDRDHQEPRNLSPPHVIQDSPGENVSPIKNRKRRREDGRFSTRNVIQRRGSPLPDIHIKEEPRSPPPVTDIPGNQIQRYRPIAEEPQGYRREQREEPRTQPRIIENGSPYPREMVVYREASPHNPMTPTYVERGPPPRRVLSRAGDYLEIREEPEIRREPELRRIVSARNMPPQYMAMPREEVRYASTQLQHERISTREHTLQPERTLSQAYIVQPEREELRQVETAPQPRLVRRDRSLSPQSPSNAFRRDREPMPLPPPSRQIVTDRDGNRFIQEVAPLERRASVAPVPRYAAAPPTPRYVSQGDMIPRGASIAPQRMEPMATRERVRTVAPASPPPRYVEYIPTGDASQRYRAYEPATDISSSSNRVVHVVDYPDERLERIEARHPMEPPRPREVQYMRQSVQPTMIQYEPAPPRYASVRPEQLPMQYETQVPRYASVRPEQHRLVQPLPPQREMERLPAPREAVLRDADGFARPPTREVVIRDGDGYVRPPPPGYGGGEGPRYQYVPEGYERRYVGQGEVLMDGAAKRAASQRPML